MDIINAAKSVNTTGEELLLKKKKNVVDTWECTLKATGGTLRSDKFYWYIIDYKDI